MVDNQTWNNDPGAVPLMDTELDGDDSLVPDPDDPEDPDEEGDWLALGDIDEANDPGRW